MKINTGLRLQSSRDVMNPPTQLSRVHLETVLADSHVLATRAPFFCCNVPRDIRMLSAFKAQLKISQ
jgi:hypothetical protein